MYINQLRRLPKYFKRGYVEAKGWGVLSPQDRKWEDAYRSRWQHDKIVRSTHGVNCTGSCSWKVYVKGGVVTWETQQTDYPTNGPNIPEYEPRGCPRGASFSWYLYSPLRIKYPYIRSDLWKLWKEALLDKKDEVAAWQSIVEDPEKRKIYKQSRGKGGFIRINHEDAFKIISAALIYTIKKFGPDRIFGFTPIPAMSMVSYASGTRFLSLIGGVIVSFYDWYCDLPPASPMIWGEQTDVPESADWYNSMYIIIWGANLPITRTPDAHFMVEARYKGTKVVVISPDYSDHVKFGDLWIPIKPGTDAALAMSMVHVIIKEFYIDRKVDYFIQYIKRYTDLPFLVILEPSGNYFETKRFLVASDLGVKISNSDWKAVVWDSKTNSFAIPNGSIGFRWEDNGKWNLKLEYEGREIDPEITFISDYDEVLSVAFPYFDEKGKTILIRGVPAKKIKVGDKEIYLATVFDLLLAHVGIRRDLPGDYPENFDDPKPFTPAWQEKITGVSKDIAIQVAREFAKNAELTSGKSMVIMGSGINHWFHADLIYRAIITMILLTGCQGKNGGGWAHYVGQEKVRPLEGWSTVAFALDWIRPPRQQNGTSFFYFATDQWRYEEINAEFISSPLAKKYNSLHFADFNVLAVRLGWLPFYPQFDKNPIELAKEAEKDQLPSKYIANKLRKGEIKFAIEDPDNFYNVPKILFVWRANVLGASGKGHEYFLKHLLGTTNSVLEEESNIRPKLLNYENKSEEGKLDLLVDINFRMDGTALYSDIVLPAATWYEKYDLSTTDLHPFVHPFTPAVDPLWESMSDWDTFKQLAKTFSEMASKHFPEKIKDVVASPLLHDSPDEIAQPKGEILDWKESSMEPIPGKTTQKFSIVERYYPHIYEMMTSLGPLILKEGIGVKGVKFIPKEEYEKLKNELGTVNEGFSKGLVKMTEAIDVAEVILTLSGATNGSISLKGWEYLEKKCGVELKDLIEGHSDVRYQFKDLVQQPRRVLTTPVWSGIEKEGRQYTAFAVNIEKNIPWRTFTGRQQIYLDHELIREFGEALPLYKPPLSLPPIVDKELLSKIKTKYIIVRWITPHNKWSIHTTYADNIFMLTLFRGGPVIWLNDEDAKELGVSDNDWIEAINRNGVMVARAVISHRIPKGSAFTYHAFDRTINVPLSKTSKTSAGLHNSLTKIRVKPIHMIGGYAQLSYSFNYWGPTGNQRDSIAIIKKVEEGEVE